MSQQLKVHIVKKDITQMSSTSLIDHMKKCAMEYSRREEKGIRFEIDAICNDAVQNCKVKQIMDVS